MEETKQVTRMTKGVTTGLIDLHIHTNASDGDKTAKEIETEIKKIGASAYAITDHDTVKGIEGFTPSEASTIFISGVEISSVDPKLDPKSRLHILGYDMNINDENFKNLMKKQNYNSISSITQKWDYLKDHFEEIHEKIPEKDFEQILQKNSNIGSPDLALLLIKYGIVKEFPDAYKHYIDEASKNVQFSKKSTTPEEIIPIIQKAGGIVSIAHPITAISTCKELRDYLLYLKQYGLEAIEVQHIKHNNEWRKILRNICEKDGFYESGGTDYHGPTVKPNVKLLTGINHNIEIKELSLVKEIKRRRSI